MKQISGRRPPTPHEATCPILINKNAIRIYASLNFLPTAIQKIITNLLPSLYFTPFQVIFNPDTGE